VRTATDGEEGLRPGDLARFDIILLDLLMPKKPASKCSPR